MICYDRHELDGDDPVRFRWKVNVDCGLWTVRKGKIWSQDLEKALGRRYTCPIGVHIEGTP